MTVYVDALRGPGAAAVARGARQYGATWCHLLADTEDELHAFAAKIGLQRFWAQHEGRATVHYDLVPRARERAGHHGAVETTTRYALKQRISELRREGHP